MRYDTPQESSRAVRETARDHGLDTGSFLIDDQGTIVGFDNRMERLTGWTASEVVGVRSGSPVLASGPIGRILGDCLDLTLRCKDGSLIEVEAGLARGAGRGGHAAVSVLRVVARSEEGRVAPTTGRDPLTGLATRERFLERLGVELRAAAIGGRPLAVILADVDHLRKVADLHGAEAAATVLRKLAGVVRATVRDEDVVARIEDDDFALILPGLGRGSARQVAARLRSTVERFRFRVPEGDDRGIAITLSLGAASYPTDADNDGDLMARAREALGEARALGRNRVWCYTRRPRIPVRTPVYLDGATPLLLGYSQDLSPSGVFVATPAPIDVGMRCALSFPLPSAEGNVHVIGRVVRTVPLHAGGGAETRAPGMGVEFEKFGSEDRRAIESYLFETDTPTLRPEGSAFSV
jgi:diguanylate cyclase (GGDEF)-like protein